MTNSNHHLVTNALPGNQVMVVSRHDHRDGKDVVLQGEVKIDSPILGNIQATNGVAYMAVAFLGLAILLGVYLKFHKQIHHQFRKKSK